MSEASGSEGGARSASIRQTRRDLIESIQARVQERIDAAGCLTTEHKQILESLIASRGRLQFIRAGQCTEYITSWQRDRLRWRGFMNGMRPIRRVPAGMTPIDVALTRFGLQQVTWRTGGPRPPAQTPAGSPREPVAVA